MTDKSGKSWVESMPYPSGLAKWLFKSPILFHRLGLSFLAGRIFMVMTTIGRKSGSLRRTAIEFHEFRGRKYVFGNWGAKADWYRNIEAQPNITIQTWRGAESVTARKLVTESELAEAFEYSMSNPSMRMVLKAIGFELNLEQFIAHKDRFTFVTFDPTDQSTPPPLEADLWWVWLVAAAIVFVVILG